MGLNGPSQRTIRRHAARAVQRLNQTVDRVLASDRGPVATVHDVLNVLQADQEHEPLPNNVLPTLNAEISSNDDPNNEEQFTQMEAFSASSDGESANIQVAVNFNAVDGFNDCDDETMALNNDEPANEYNSSDAEMVLSDNYEVSSLNDEESDSNSCDKSNNCDEGTRITQELARLKIEFAAPNGLIERVADLFRSVGINLPKDARTICQTDVAPVKDKSFLYIGMEESLKQRVRSLQSSSHCPETLSLHIYIDGIKLYKSSNKGFWPIVGAIANVDKRIEPFVIACYCGDSKPPSIQEYLREFIEEYLRLKVHGVRIDDQHYRIKIKCIICDAQARAFIKGIKGQNGYSACERCQDPGVWEDHVTMFTSLDAELRTDDNFRAMEDEDHHNVFSPLLQIEDLDMVFDIPYDYMHLVCIGVFQRMLKQIWNDGKLPHCFSSSQKALFNGGIMKLKPLLPSEFTRSGRPLQDIAHWKAIEYRTVLLYTGPFLLKGILTQEKFEHFLYLHVAIRLLCERTIIVQRVQFAEHCLRYFVSKFADIYGVKHLTYNVHALIHLAKECLYQNAGLDEFSAFRFESFLGLLKRLIVGRKHPLAQLKNRLSEMKKLDEQGHHKTRYQHEGGPPSIESVNPKKEKDSYCMDRLGNVYKIGCKTDAEVFGELLPRSYHADGRREEFFSLVMADGSSFLASDIKIFIVRSCGTPFRRAITHFDKATKCVCFPRDESTRVIYPLLHQFS